MKVSELIAFLQTCNQDAIVVTDGYEGGIEELALQCCSKIVPLKLNVRKNGWEGPHEFCKKEQADAFAVYLPR
jgi:hypothetical protein